MMRIAVVMKRILLEMIRDKRTLALIFIMPIVILSLVYILFNGETVSLKLGVIDIDEQLEEILEEMDVFVIEYKSDIDYKETVINDDLDGLLIFSTNDVELILQNNDPLRSDPLEMKIKQAFAARNQNELLEKIGFIPAGHEIEIDVQYIYGSSETEFFDVLSTILIGFFVFFFVFLLSGIGFLKERTSGTMEKLMSTPIRRYEILLAYLGGFGVFAIIQTVIVVLYAVYVLDFVLVGPFWLVIVINLLLALVALSLGTFLSSFANSEFQMVQFIPVVIVPQVFFSGIIPFETMAEWVQYIGKLMPLYYGGRALQEVMYKGNGLPEIANDLLIISLFAVIFILLNLLSLRRYRKV